MARMAGQRTVLVSLVCAAVVALCCGRDRSDAPTASGTVGHDHEYAQRPPAPLTLEEIAAAARALGDPVAAARITRVRLVGDLELPDGGGRVAVEEIAVWPDRYELRVRGAAARPPAVALAGPDLRLSLPAGWPGSFRPDERFARQRLRSLFILRHVAAALGGGGKLSQSGHPTENTVALATRDRYGEFGIIWGGVQGRMLAIEEGRAFVHFPAFLRAGPWFLPAMQSYEADGVLVAVVYVTSVETQGDR